MANTSRVSWSKAPVQGTSEADPFLLEPHSPPKSPLTRSSYSKPCSCGWGSESTALGGHRLRHPLGTVRKRGDSSCSCGSDGHCETVVVKHAPGLYFFSKGHHPASR